MTIVDHSRDHDLTIYGQQAACFHALYYATTEDGLPAATWTISDLTGPDEQARAVGQVYRPDGDNAAKRRVVQAWADAMHQPVSEYPSSDGLLIEAQGWHRGIRVRVWALLTNPPEVT